MRIDQFIPAFHRGDAIGDTAFHMRNFFRSLGYEADIYCLNCDEELRGEARLFSAFPGPAPADLVILHFALPSPLTQELIKLPCRKAIVYHNITPAGFFAGFSEEMARLSELGRRELESLAPYIDLALADSEFNRQELERLGFKRSETFPLFIDFSKYQKPRSRLVYDLYRDERVNILFVGRIAPNKKIENLIKVTFYFKKYISPLVRLIVVGKTSSLPKYYQSLVRLADEFLLKSDEILFTGHIPDEELFAFYQASGVFLSLSEHEGFCLPLIESMIFDLPVIALDSTAVPYTLDGAGVLIRDSRADLVGELVEIVAHDERLREKILKGQRRRLEKYRSQDWQGFLLEKVRSLGP